MSVSLCRRLDVRSLFVSRAIPRLLLFSSVAEDSLYRRISPLGNPSISIVPVLDQWFKEGNPVDREQLRRIIMELRKYRRFTHALQVWF